MPADLDVTALAQTIRSVLYGFTKPAEVHRFRADALDSLDVLLAEPGRLQQERDEWKAKGHVAFQALVIAGAKLGDAERERDAALTANQQLRDALERYGKHLPQCRVYVVGGIHVDQMGQLCTCGFAAALVVADSPEEAPS